MRKKLSAYESDIILPDVSSHLMRKRPCIITSARTPLNFFIRFATKDVCVRQNEMEKLLRIIYSPVLKGGRIEDTFTQELWEEMQQSLTDSSFQECLRNMNNYGVVEHAGAFHRADICDFVDKKSYLVELVDTGLTKHVKPEEIYPMALKLLEYPRNCIPCKLPLATGTNAETKRFQELILSHESWILLIISIENNIHLSHLTTIDGKLSIDEELVKLRTDPIPWNPIEDDFMELTSKFYEDDIDLEFHGISIKDDAVICPIFAQHGECFKKEACRKKHIFCDPDKLTNLKEPAFIDIAKLPVLSKYRSYEITHVFLNRLGQIYCSVYEDDCQFEPQFKKMENQMNRPELIHDYSMLNGLPCAFEIVLCKVKDIWYRGRFLELDPETNLCTILLVDFGNVEELPLKMLRAIPREFTQVPLRLRQVCLKNYMTLSHKTTQDFLDFLLQFWPLTLEIMAYHQHYDLVEIFDKDKKSIGPDLEEAGFVEKRTLCEPTDQCFPDF